jgi:hypothetical protein
MQCVIRPRARAAALFLVAPFLAFASALAPQHIHEQGHGHEHPVAHSHFAPHDVDVHQTAEMEIEPDVEHVIWLDSSFLHEPPHQTARMAVATPIDYEIVATESAWSATPFDEAAPVHGPPRRAHLFRGPPLPA